MVPSLDRSDRIKQSNSKRKSRGDETFKGDADRNKLGKHHSTISVKEEDASTTTMGLHHHHPSSRSQYDKSLPCINRPHFFYPEWNGDECEHESFFCFSEAVNNHCCKCRPECCGQCNTLASSNDPYHACPIMVDGRHNKIRNFEENTKAIVLGVIAVTLTFIFCIRYIGARKENKMDEVDPDYYNKKKNIQEFRDDEYYDNEGNFENNVRSHKSFFSKH